MPFNEVRKDYLLDRWVVIAIERSRRPTDFAKPERKKAKATVCPLCPGNEHMTPPAILVYLKQGERISKDKDRDGFRHKNWLIRCVSNLYPAFTPPEGKIRPDRITQRSNLRLAVGHHEVLVESPVHNMHPAEMEIPQLIYVINAYIDRLRELSAKPYVKYVSIFRNHGLEAGASLSHAHSQLIATPFIPKTVNDEFKASRKFWNQKQKCVFCEIVERELKGPRLILENMNFAAFAPYASVNPLEFWIFPKKHDAAPLNLSQGERQNFAGILKTCLKGLKQLINDPPYNYGFHMAIGKGANRCYHWHLEIYPKLAIWAGFEKSTGVYINAVTPETAAADMRRAISP